MKTVGIVGGGQLGKMLAEAAKPLGLRMVVLDPTPNCPAAQVADKHVVGDFRDHDTVVAFAKEADVLTFEIESANAQALEELVSRGFPVHPTPTTLAIIKDKLRQKRFLTEHGISVAPFAQVDDAETLGYPYILKARSGGFDGRGNALVEKKEDLPAAWEKIGNVPAYAEGLVSFDKELAIVAARTTSGEIQVYPLVETIHKDHICHMVLAPAPVNESIVRKAHAVAEKVLQAFDGAGVFGIEMFLVGGDVLVNEIAPRVHNSGHFSIEGSITSQFENHMRAVAGLPLGSTDMKAPAAVMINILGGRNGPATPSGVEEAQKIPGVGVHMYGKVETRIGRKMGHLTAVGNTLEEAKAAAEQAFTLISI